MPTEYVVPLEKTDAKAKVPLLLIESVSLPFDKINPVPNNPVIVPLNEYLAGSQFRLIEDTSPEVRVPVPPAILHSCVGVDGCVLMVTE